MNKVDRREKNQTTAIKTSQDPTLQIYFLSDFFVCVSLNNRKWANDLTLEITGRSCLNNTGAEVFCTTTCNLAPYVLCMFPCHCHVLDATSFIKWPAAGIKLCTLTYAWTHVFTQTYWDAWPSILGSTGADPHQPALASHTASSRRHDPLGSVIAQPSLAVLTSEVCPLKSFLTVECDHSVNASLVPAHSRSEFQLLWLFQLFCSNKVAFKDLLKIRTVKVAFLIHITFSFCISLFKADILIFISSISCSGRTCTLGQESESSRVWKVKSARGMYHLHSYCWWRLCEWKGWKDPRKCESIYCLILGKKAL